MNGVRFVVLAVGIVLLFVFVMPRQTMKTIKTADGTRTFRYIEKVLNAAEDTPALPIVIALHGYGDRPGNFLRSVMQIKEPVRLIVLEAFQGKLRKQSWYDPATAVQSIPEAADNIILFIDCIVQEKKSTQKPIVYGFSQGAILAYYLALHYPENVSCVVPVCGYLYAGLIPKQRRYGIRYPMIYAFNALDDILVTEDEVRLTHSAIRKLDIKMSLEKFTGRHLPHQQAQRMIFKKVDECIKKMAMYGIV